MSEAYCLYTNESKQILYTSLYHDNISITIDHDEINPLVIITPRKLPYLWKKKNYYAAVNLLNSFNLATFRSILPQISALTKLTQSYSSNLFLSTCPPQGIVLHQTGKDVRMGQLTCYQTH